VVTGFTILIQTVVVLLRGRCARGAVVPALIFDVEPGVCTVAAAGTWGVDDGLVPSTGEGVSVGVLRTRGCTVVRSVLAGLVCRGCVLASGGPGTQGSVGQSAAGA